MWYHAVLLFGISYLSDFVTARFCEGGHICSLPRECCTQGCCPPYQNTPRQLPPSSEHVLNLFFINHWFFWCVVLAVILAILCAYSLWKKRRTLCGWGFTEHYTQSEGDSAGSCYAPPQYSRCSSFHHPPPPYTEVTSKPDLYPLVFTCNNDNGKTSSSYLMVQYFRNYIVRPAGSLSAASTVDSLSSSFICNANEANTLVPPPYSRAASPEDVFSSQFQQQYMIPRSASQLVCSTGAQQDAGGGNQHQSRTTHYTVVTLNGATGGVGSITGAAPYNKQLRTSESGNFRGNNDLAETTCNGCGNCSNNGDNNSSTRDRRFVQSQSDQHFRYMENSNSSISDIFVNNTCSADIGGKSVRSEDTAASMAEMLEEATTATAVSILPKPGGTPVVFSNGCIKPNLIYRTNTNPTPQFIDSKRDPVYNSSNSIEGISITVPISDGKETDFRDIQMLRRSLETCCQFLQQQQQIQSPNFTNGGSPLRSNELTKKFTEEGLLSYVTSGTCSEVSSLANVGTPSSPPQATSPTGEVKEILDQIRQLQDVVYDDLIANTRPPLYQTTSSPSSACTKHSSLDFPQQHFAKISAQENSPAASAGNTSAVDARNHSPLTPNAMQKLQISTKTASSIASKRPCTLQQGKKKLYLTKPSKAMYSPMVANPIQSSNRCILKSPVSSIGANFFSNRGRIRKVWISRSAPTTPATNLPLNCIGDDSPLLTEHDEDHEAEENAEIQ